MFTLIKKGYTVKPNNSVEHQTKTEKFSSCLPNTNFVNIILLFFLAVNNEYHYILIARRTSCFLFYSHANDCSTQTCNDDDVDTKQMK